MSGLEHAMSVASLVVGCIFAVVIGAIFLLSVLAFIAATWAIVRGEVKDHRARRQEAKRYHPAYRTRSDYAGEALTVVAPRPEDIDWHAWHRHVAALTPADFNTPQGDAT